MRSRKAKAKRLKLDIPQEERAVRPNAAQPALFLVYSSQENILYEYF